MEFLKSVQTSRFLLLLNILLSLLYFVCVVALFPIGNWPLFVLLVVSEVFHVWQVFGFIHTVWYRKRVKEFDARFTPDVAVFITVCGEPGDIIESTVIAAKAMKYPNFSIYILNDGKVANRDNWHEAEEIAARQGVTCITRETPGGAKAGNINNATKLTQEPYIVVFDADHEPKPEFLQQTMGYFIDEKVAFVQSPQFYKNADVNQVAGGSWEQQALFFGPLLKGKDSINATFMCGTNMVLRRVALDEAGGMSEKSIAEDFLTSLLIHEKKWKSVYVDKVLAEGLAPEDFLSYYKQQFRWARGSLELLFSYNPFFRRGLTWAQRIQYLSSSSYYLSGIIVLINALLPLTYFFFQLKPLTINTMTLALIFLPYIIVILYTLQITSNFTYTFRALSFSLGSSTIYMKALWATITRRQNAFAVTSKKKVSGNHGKLVLPHLVYIGLVVAGVVWGVFREGWSASMLSNIAWAIIYIAAFLPFISAAFEGSREESKRKKVGKNKDNVTQVEATA
jgi:cellulose synthase (UDP-forming)